MSTIQDSEINYSTKAGRRAAHLRFLEMREAGAFSGYRPYAIVINQPWIDGYSENYYSNANAVLDARGVLHDVNMAAKQAYPKTRSEATATMG